jgi:RNA polymerase sigma factor (TIGR02999 family)
MTRGDVDGLTRPATTLVEVDILALLDGSRAGDAEASRKSQAAVYEALRTLEHRQLLSGGNTLNTTALVHEAWLKLVNNARRDFESRAHFFAIAAKAMRQILIDHARSGQAKKRGGGQAFVTSAPSSVGADSNVEELLAVDAILARLETRRASRSGGSSRGSRRKRSRVH